MKTALALSLLASVFAASAVNNITSSHGTAVHIPIDHLFNNQAFGSFPGEASFDLLNQSYPAKYLPSTNGTYTSTHTGLTYDFPGYRGLYTNDNVLCEGQTIKTPEESYFSLQLLVAADLDTTSGNLTFTYTDNTTSTSELRSLPYYAFLTLNKGEIILPYRYTSNDTNYNTTHIFEYITALDPSKKLSSVTLPDTSNTTDGSRLHIFSTSLWKGTGVQAQYVRPTQKWTGNQFQIVEVAVNNAGPDWVAGEGIEVGIVGPGVVTVEPATIKRLRPGDQKIVNIAVAGYGTGAADVVLSGFFAHSSFRFENVTFGLEEYTSDLESLTLHESPDWFNDAKFGIFLHWGPYSVPSWGNSTPWEVYAEWYWWYGHHLAADKADVYNHHLETYGPDLVYDDFFTNFTAENFDPKAWVDLFAEAGAQYFVLTTKHHDGFALFDSEETTHRNALHYGPKKDLLQELFDAAKTYQPQLHRGTYFSLPEWYNPDFGPYGFAQLPGNASTSWPGILANNPYTGAVEPYTGRLNISDFITDLMVPQMELLAYKYGTEIMWCDCGTANGTAEFASAWYNHAKQEGREVTMNSRCGIPQGSDFDTPEYTTFSSVSQRKWESNQGMDPYSYGFNRATPASSYMNASTVVSSLVDMVSKNGNFLLDVGPKADGTIDETEVANLKEAGTWIHANAEAIFNTTYWFITPESGDIRFTQTADAFYILLLTKPENKLTILAPIPILEGDRLTMIGAGNGEEVAWAWSEGGLDIMIPPHLVDSGKYCWVLKLDYWA